jgi:xylulokinase
MITLGIDNGTQSTKVIALDSATGAVLAHATQSYNLIAGLPAGHMEQHPADWLTAAEYGIQTVLEKLGARRGEVRAIGVSGQQHGFVPLDAEGQVIRPAKLWCDTSTVEECDAYRSHFGGTDGLMALIGNDMLPGFTAPKILWLKRHEPENFARLAHVLLPHDYLNYWLTGNYSMEYGDASGTALFDIETRTWSLLICNFIDPQLISMLPAVTSSLGVAGRLRPAHAEKWGLSAEVVVSAGGGDNMMGAIGTGNVRTGVVTASLGTSGTIYAYAHNPMIDLQGEIAAFCDSTDGWMPLVCTMNVTVATELVRKMFGWDHAQQEQAILSVPPGAEGLLFLPYLQGERIPNLPQGTGVFYGLKPHNFTAAHQARAVMEGVTLGLAYGFQRLAELGVHPTEVRLTGGGSQSGVWRQICADVFGCPVVTLQNAEGAALGAALQALAVASPDLHLTAWTDQIVQVNRAESAQPRPELTALYATLLSQQTQLTRKIFGA